MKLIASVISFCIVGAAAAAPALSDPRGDAAVTGRNGTLVKEGALSEPSRPGGERFAALSPGNRRIAQALFRAQQLSAAGGGGGGVGEGRAPAPWSLDRIATAREQASGWGEVFRRMQDDRVIDGPGLAQIIGQEWVREFREHKDSMPAAPVATDVVVTYTNNRSSVVITRGHPGYTAVRASAGAAGAGGVDGGTGR